MRPVRIPEAVAEPRFRDNIARIVRIRLDLFAQPADVDPQVFILVIALVSPDPSQELLVRENAAGVRGELPLALSAGARQVQP